MLKPWIVVPMSTAVQYHKELAELCDTFCMVVVSDEDVAEVAKTIRDLELTKLNAPVAQIDGAAVS